MSDVRETGAPGSSGDPDPLNAPDAVAADSDSPPEQSRRTMWVIAGVAVALLAIAAIWWFQGAATVPDVVGVSQVNAAATIEAAGLVVGQASVDPTLGVEPGTVTGQEPAAGTDVREGEKVDLLVASVPDVTVPDVVGMSSSQAEAELAIAGLRVGEVIGVSSAEVAEGTVLSQSPEADAEASVASAVALEISTGPEEGAVPDVTGLTSADAMDVLESAGFDVGEISKTSTDVEPGVVTSQDPGAGEVAREGTTVTITVSSGAPAAPEPAPPVTDGGTQPETPSTPEAPPESPPVERPDPEPEPSLVEVPNLIGMRILEAWGAIRDAKLQFSIAWGPTDADYLTVIEQDPGAGAEVEPGTVVTVTIGLPSFLFDGIEVQPLPAEPEGGAEESGDASGAVAPSN